MIEIGQVEAIFRYPVKSMRGEMLQAAEVGWHGLTGDRRLAFRKANDRSGFPWLSATRLADLILYKPCTESGQNPDLPTHVRTPAGRMLPVYSEELAAEVADRYGAPLEMMHVRSGIFDDGAVSVITTATVDEIGRLAAQPGDMRRFRPNIVVRSIQAGPFSEENWLGSTLHFGPEPDGPTVSVTMRDARCAMINLHPDSAESSPAVLKAVVRQNANNAGVYGTVTRTGQIAVGQVVFMKSGER